MPSKPGGWCGNPKCICVPPSKYTCPEYLGPVEEGPWCPRCGHDRGDHRVGRRRILLHNGRKP